MNSLYLPANYVTNRGKVVVFILVCVFLYVLLGGTITSKQLIRSTTATPSIQLVLTSDILENVDDEKSNKFVLLSESKLRAYMRAAEVKSEERKKSPDDILRSIQTHTSNTKADDTKAYNKKYINVVAKPNLSDMINASQSIPTVTAAYRFENPTLCSSVQNLAALIIVHTACKHTERRLSIRQTWANSSYYEEPSRILFLVGFTAQSDNKTQRDIASEFSRYGDLLVGDFEDTYQNLTLKGVMAYKWINERCRNANMILKVDDDITVDMFRFFRDIYPKYFNKPRHIICNYILSGSMPILRDRNSKWFVSKSHFKGFSSYPTDYCSGFFVLMTNDLIPSLYASAKITPFFWVDDVYLYGLVPGNVPGVQYIGLTGNWHMLGGQDALRCYKNATLTCPYLALGAGAKGEPEDLWHEILKRQAILSINT